MILYIGLIMRVCWNRQTGTFEGRVSLTYGFKSKARTPEAADCRASGVLQFLSKSHLVFIWCLLIHGNIIRYR